MNNLAFLNRYRKLILIILFLGVCFLIGYFIFRLFFQPSVPVTGPAGTPTSTTGQLPGAGNGGAQVVTTTQPGGIPGAATITTPSAPVNPEAAVSAKAQGGITQTTALTSSPGLGVTLSPNGKDVQYYNQTDGKFYRVDANGNAVALSDKVFHDVQKIEWAPNGTKAVLEYPDGTKTVYDFSANKQVTLPSHWEDFDFSPDSSSLVMKSIGIDPENSWLATAKADGSESKAIENIGSNGDQVYDTWSPNNQVVALYTDGLDFSRQTLYFEGQNGENFKSTVIEGRGFDPLWSKNGDNLLYSVYSPSTDMKPSLWIVGAQGDSIGSNRTPLQVNTWADKCTFVNDKDVYCAVPDNLESGSGIVPDLENETQDSLYKIDTTTGAKQLIAVPNGKYNISNLTVSDDQSKLYFTDNTTKQIYKINLK